MKSENLQLYKSTFIKTGTTFIQKSHKTPKRKLENFPPSLVAISVSLLRIFLTAPFSRSRIDYCLDAGELSARSFRHARRSFDSYISWRESTLRMGESGYAKSSARPLAETSHKSSSRRFRCRPRRHTNRDINTIYHSHTFCTTKLRSHTHRRACDTLYRLNENLRGTWQSNLSALKGNDERCHEILFFCHWHILQNHLHDAYPAINNIGSNLRRFLRNLYTHSFCVWTEKKIRSTNKTEESEEWRREARIYGPKDIVRLNSSYRLGSATAAEQNFGFYCLLAACLSHVCW